MSTGVWIALGAVVVAVVFGAYRALTDGRFRAVGAAPNVSAGPASAGSAAASAESAESEDPTESADPAVPARSGGSAAGHPTWPTVAAAAGVAPGERATLVQFSSAFCAPCRVTRRVLADVAGSVPGVVHVDIDAEQHLDVVRRLGILRTPTTIVLDGSGREVARAAGAPRKEQVLSAIYAADPTF